MKKFFLILPFLWAFTSFVMPVERLQVRLFAHLSVQTCELTVESGSYRLVADGGLLREATAGQTVRLVYSNDSIAVKAGGVTLGHFRFIKLAGDVAGCLKIRITDPDRKPRSFMNSLSVAVIDGGLRLVNEVEMDHYVAGVTEAEAGPRSTLEFYKVQAILVRTFALAHINKHVAEGFNLCDQVHCQAYYGKPHEPKVLQAVAATRNMVVVDENLDLINAAFHSNSGGETANSEDVWGSRTTYLRSVTDTFSTRMPNWRWERRMLADDWLSYLKLKHNFPVDNDSGRNAALSFTQNSRKVFLEFNNNRVPLRNVRQDLQLKSTFFSVERIGNDSIVLRGRGYGHGLGMCQEGAMCMARKGYTYPQILSFYYHNVQLMDLHKLEFFRDE